MDLLITAIVTAVCADDDNLIRRLRARLADRADVAALHAPRDRPADDLDSRPASCPQDRPRQSPAGAGLW